MGASDVVAFQANSQQYIVFANREDNDGNPSPNVDSPVFAWTGLQFERVQVLHDIVDECYVIEQNYRNLLASYYMIV